MRTLTTEYSLELTLSANAPPAFNNLGNFPETLSPGDTLNFDVNWQDSQGDQISFNITESLSWLYWQASGDIIATPDSNDVGSYDIIFSIDDGCYEVSAEKTLTID